MALLLDVVLCLSLLPVASLRGVASGSPEPLSLKLAESRKIIPVILPSNHSSNGSVVLLVSQPAPQNASLHDGNKVVRRAVQVEANSQKTVSSSFVEVVGHVRGKRNVVDCSNWDATITLTASLVTRQVDIETRMLTDPGCKSYNVMLWQLVDDTHGLECILGIVQVGHVEVDSSKLSRVTFENMTTGNYCARITPQCPALDGCLTLYSKMVELPERAEHDKDAAAPGMWLNDIYLFIMLIPMVAFIALTWFTCLKKRHVQTTSTSTSVENVSTCKDDNGVPNIKVVYSRDSAQHNESVACLCRFLETEARVRVIYDENAHVHLHLTSDWAIDMADVYCPRFSAESAKSRGVTKILVIESDGGIIKQDAHHNYKDVGSVSTDITDESYYITYNALLSRQAQALGDYCHIFVARFSYTTNPSRLHLVPEKRYVLPQHTRELLSALLYTGSSKKLDPETLDRMLNSESYQRLLLIIDSVKNSLEENPGLIRDKLRTIIVDQ